MKSAKHLPSRPLVASQYDDGDDDGCGPSENRLRFWLKLEQWSLEEATAVLCYIEPDSVKWSEEGGTLLAARSLMRHRAPAQAEDDQNDDENNGSLNHRALESVADDLRDTKRLIGGPESKRNVEPPATWIRVALDRGMELPWLPWAQRIGLQQPIAADKALHSKERQTLLKIIAALCVAQKFDLTKPHAAAISISASCDLIGLRLSDNTIVKYLKDAAAMLPSDPLNKT